MKRTTLPLATLALAGAVAFAACEATPTEAPADVDALHGDHAGHVMNQRPEAAPAHGAPDLARIRAGTARYRNFAHAEADGFIPVSPCIDSPAGAMGFHYEHPDRLATISVDAARPEILLYVPAGGGRMELVGVEFVVDRTEWHDLHGADKPSVAGRTFDEPIPGHPALDNAYSLHVWLWADNPSGLFAPFNPDVSCG